jgi:hypothetical protein
MKKLLLTLAVGSLIATPVVAVASDFNVALDKTQNLALESTLNVTVAGIPQDQGIYLMLCEGSSPTPRPANCSGTHQAWLTTAASSLRMGATAALPVNEFKIASEFETRSGTKVNCLTSKCGVFVRRDHFAGADLTLDRFIPISFAAPRPNSAAIIGSFKNRVAVRVWGGNGQELKLKIGGRWVKTELTQNNALASFRVGQKTVLVEVYLGGIKLAEKEVTLN